MDVKSQMKTLEEIFFWEGGLEGLNVIEDVRAGTWRFLFIAEPTCLV